MRVSKEKEQSLGQIPTLLELQRWTSVPDGLSATMEAMKARIHTLVPTPATLGGRAASMPHRLAACMHSLAVLLGDLHSLPKLVASIVSITTDLGVESGLHKLLPFEPRLLLPFFGHEQQDEAAWGEDCPNHELPTACHRGSLNPPHAPPKGGRYLGKSHSCILLAPLAPCWQGS